ncbi:MAG: NAD kinase, partial [Zoogloeaceae bacterium]|nr:NAD kinase [Zoogloeaceae bacterium]
MTFFSHSPQEPDTIALIGKYQSNAVNQALVALAEYLQERGVTVFIERETAENLACETDPNRWLVCGFADIGAH